MTNNVPPKVVYLAESHTSITTSTNGEEVHVESNDSGSIHVETINGETTITTSPGMKVDVTKGEAKVETPNTGTTSAKETTEEIKKEIEEKKKKLKNKSKKRKPKSR